MSKEAVHKCDVAVIGGGPAGLSGALWLSRFMHDVVLVDSGDPRNWEAREIHGYLGMSHTRPADLRREGRQTCREYGATLLDAHVGSAEVMGREKFEFLTDAGHRIVSRRVLLTTGIRDRLPNIPGLHRCFGTSVHTCPNCDGYEARFTPTAVLGNGEAAVFVARALKTWTDEITICTNGKEISFPPTMANILDQMGIGIALSPIEVLEEQHRHVRALQFRNGQRLACEHIFLAMGQRVRDRVASQLGCDSDDRGRVVVDPHHHTSVWNVFAAGDVTPGAQMALRAAAGGAEASLSIHHSLIPAEQRVHRRC